MILERNFGYFDKIKRRGNQVEIALFRGFAFEGSPFAKLERLHVFANLYLNWILLIHCAALVNKSGLLRKPAKFYSTLFQCFFFAHA